jgi:Nucleotidyl transferase
VLLVLLPAMGIMGAALAWAGACGVQLASILRGLRYKHGIPPSSLLKITGSDVGALLSARARPIHWGATQSSDRWGRGKWRAMSIKAVILCGGAGTRIRDVADDIPKPIISIGDRPVPWHIMKTCAHYGIEDFVLCLGRSPLACNRS